MSEVSDELSDMKMDAEWRRRWHERLGRGNQTEGKFYESIEQQLTDATRALAALKEKYQELEVFYANAQSYGKERAQREIKLEDRIASFQQQIAGLVEQWRANSLSELSGYRDARCADELALSDLRETLAWRPIASAPKDGTFVLLWAEQESECALVGYFGSRWELAHSDTYPFDPTHWLPLPTSPEEP